MNNKSSNTYHAMTIAGSDSCGGAGIQADLKTFNACAVQAASVLTAITAQNTAGVSQVTLLSPDMVQAQLRAVLDELPIRAAKTGMLANAEIIETVITGLTASPDLCLVVDPVMVATSGARLLDRNAEAAMRERLLPRATLVTPNLPEAAALTGLAEDHPVEALGEALLALGCKAVLLKGGHSRGERVEDLLLTPDSEARFSHPRRPMQVHGTGCALSAAIAAHIARGENLETAVDQAINWLQQQLDHAWTAPNGKLAMLPFASA